MKPINPGGTPSFERQSFKENMRREVRHSIREHLKFQEDQMVLGKGAYYWEGSKFVYHDMYNPMFGVANNTQREFFNTKAE